MIARLGSGSNTYTWPRSPTDRRTQRGVAETAATVDHVVAAPSRSSRLRDRKVAHTERPRDVLLQLDLKCRARLCTQIESGRTADILRLPRQLRGSDVGAICCVLNETDVQMPEQPE